MTASTLERDTVCTPTTRGVHHVGLTVPNLPAAEAFFTEVLGFRVVGEIAEYPAVFVSDDSVMITLWQAKGSVRHFDRHTQVGLHHLALVVDDLDALAQRLLAHPDVGMEFVPEPLGDGGTRHMMIAMPGGVRIEFIAPARR